MRRTEARLNRIEEEENKIEREKLEDENRKLEDGAREDVKRYLVSCKKRRRLSLAFRAKENRQHQKWKKKEKEKKINERHMDSTFHSLDQKFVALAKEKERAKLALDALFHQSRGCSFGQNPFAFILE